MTQKDKKASERPADTQAQSVEDEPDAWEERINRTGCAAENERLTDCWHEKKDWRACAAEMVAFQQCWKQNRNDQRTDMKDAEQ